MITPSVSAHTRKEPYLYCETLNGLYVHLYVPVPYHKKTVCGHVVYQDGFTGNPAKRKLCNTCWHGSGR